MSDDKYFKDKAEEVFNRIKFIEGWGNDSIFNLNDPTCKLIYIALKEVARDQRYACVDAVHKNAKKFPTFGESENQRIIESIIQNANIEVKRK